MKDSLIREGVGAPPIPKGHPYHQDTKRKITPLKPKASKKKKVYSKKGVEDIMMSGLGGPTMSAVGKASKKKGMYSKKGTGLNPSYK
jgi:hypothetical protein